MNSNDPKRWLQRIHALDNRAPLRILNVCGGHERSITLAGVRQALPPQIALIPGPGCPVCVCPEEDIVLAIRLALQRQALVVAFGDLLRVPTNLPKGEPRSLEQARAAGGEIRPIASPQEAVATAHANPQRSVVFFAAGFETTMAPIAAMLLQGVPDNLSILLSGRLTWPAVAMLLASETPGFDALVAPGHVATIMGPEEWAFVVQQHQLPAAVAGFETASLLAAFYSLRRQQLTARPFLDNCYPQVVRPGGNPGAKHCLEQAFRIGDANWRGIGIIPNSGYHLAPAWSHHDARARYPELAAEERHRHGAMPPGCDCAQVVLGRIYPDQCRLYGNPCQPRNPIGPCMVSDEGACRIWWSAGARRKAAAARGAPPDSMALVKRSTQPIDER